MKRLICILLCITFLFSMSACDVRLNTTGDVKNVKVEKWEASKIYSDDEINSAIKAVENYFKKEFGGCTLTKITYAGDTESLNETAYRKENGYDYDKVIVLVSSFETDSFGGDGSLNPNSTYDNWDSDHGRKTWRQMGTYRPWLCVSLSMGALLGEPPLAAVGKKFDR